MHLNAVYVPAPSCLNAVCSYTSKMHKKRAETAFDDQGDNPGQAIEGLTVSSIKCDRWWHLD